MRLERLQRRATHDSRKCFEFPMCFAPNAVVALEIALVESSPLQWHSRDVEVVHTEHPDIAWN